VEGFAETTSCWCSQRQRRAQAAAWTLAERIASPQGLGLEISVALCPLPHIMCAEVTMAKNSGKLTAVLGP